MKDTERKIIIMGAGGSATVIASVIEDLRDTGESIDMLGFLDDKKERGEMVNNYPILGVVSEYEKYLEKENIFFIYALINPTQQRERIILLLEKIIHDNKFATVVNPTAVVS